MRELLPDCIDDELGCDEARHDEDPLAGRGGRSEREDVRARNVPDVDLTGFVRGFGSVLFGWRNMGSRRVGK